MFTSKGMEYTVELFDGKMENKVWIPKEVIVHYEPNYEHEAYKRVSRHTGRKAVMRRAISGPVTERLEPRQHIVILPIDDLDGKEYNIGNRPHLIEYLYSHHQVCEVSSQQLHRLPNVPK